MEAGSAGTRGVRGALENVRKVYLSQGKYTTEMGQVRQKGLASGETRRRKRLRFARTRVRELRMITKALASTKHPILVHVIPMRRCNLDCGYCNEYDDVSKPVPLQEMADRLSILAGMGTSIITISGGEPLMYPHVVAVKRPLFEKAATAPRLAPDLKDDFASYFAECMVRAVELKLKRMSPGEREAAMDRDDADGVRGGRALRLLLVALLANRYGCSCAEVGRAAVHRWVVSSPSATPASARARIRASPCLPR